MIDDATQWQSECTNAAYEFGLRCADLVSRSRADGHIEAPLDFIVNAFMTELWDRNFSQTEIRNAFDRAIKDMPRYAAGSERHSATSTELGTSDWRGPIKPSD